MNFVEFVEKYQQDMTPEQMLNISKMWHNING